MSRGVPRDQSVQHQILHRLKIARGHLNKVINMVENGDYCIDVIHQSQAVQSALSQADQTILNNHLNTCVVEEIKKGNSKEVIEEIMKVVGKHQN